MALIECPECNHQVSNKASACPNCGFQKQIESWLITKESPAIVETNQLDEIKSDIDTIEYQDYLKNESILSPYTEVGKIDCNIINQEKSIRIIFWFLFIIIAIALFGSSGNNSGGAADAGSLLMSSIIAFLLAKSICVIIRYLLWLFIKICG
jgi:hypothetical protein